jgi:hypothetical protein
MRSQANGWAAGKAAPKLDKIPVLMDSVIRKAAALDALVTLYGEPYTGTKLETADTAKGRTYECTRRAEGEPAGWTTVARPKRTAR